VDGAVKLSDVVEEHVEHNARKHERTHHVLQLNNSTRPASSLELSTVTQSGTVDRWRIEQWGSTRATGMVPLQGF
jgi:hypothetical protein